MVYSKKKNHFVPKFILKNFTNSDGRIHFYNKDDNSLSSEIPYRGQLQKRNFYSKKSLSKLLKIFDHISLNPIFKKIDLNLEENLDICLESKMGCILSRIIQPLINGEKIPISKEEDEFLREYIAIQHVRTPRFKKDAKEINDQILRFPENMEGILCEIVGKTEVNFKRVINGKFPNLNSKARRLKVIEFKKNLKRKLKENPNFIEEIRNSDKSKEIMKGEIKKAEEKLEKIRLNPDKHTSEILDVKLRNSFFKRCLDNKNIRFVLNETNCPFVLADTGIILMSWNYGSSKELKTYLPIHPKVLIEMSLEKHGISIADKEFVRGFNSISKEESLITVYSNSTKALETLKE